MKKFVEKILWGSTALMLVLSFGCQSGNDEFDEDSKEEDRFQFLRREEVEPHKDRKEQMRDEQVEAKAPYPHPVSKDKITKLEKRPIPKSRIIPGGSTANAPRFYDDLSPSTGMRKFPFRWSSTVHLFLTCFLLLQMC